MSSASLSRPEIKFDVSARPDEEQMLGIDMVDYECVFQPPAQTVVAFPQMSGEGANRAVAEDSVAAEGSTTHTAALSNPRAAPNTCAHVRGGLRKEARIPTFRNPGRATKSATGSPSQRHRGPREADRLQFVAARSCDRLNALRRRRRALGDVTVISV